MRLGRKYLIVDRELRLFSAICEARKGADIGDEGQAKGLREDMFLAGEIWYGCG